MAIGSGAERAKRLAEVADLAAGMRFGWQGYADRLDEFGGGFRTSTRLGQTTQAASRTRPRLGLSAASSTAGPTRRDGAFGSFDDRLRTAHVALLALYDARIRL